MTDARKAGDRPKRELLNLDEAAERRFCSRSTIERRVYAGIIPAERFGGKGGRTRTLVSAEAIDRDIQRERSHSYAETRQRRQDARDA